VSSPRRFCRYELRTRDVAAAQAFYAAVLGERALSVVPLPPHVAAAGAPPHWLGYIAVDDVERAAQAFAERGATRLGPVRPMPQGGLCAVLRDPGSAIVALCTAPLAAAESEDVVWHHLNAADLAAARSAYCELFGWQLTSQVDLGAYGLFQQFAWAAGGRAVGAMSDIAERPAVHPHWLFYFGVSALDSALATVSAEGGSVIGPLVLPDGARIAVCDDPQGAAFALREHAMQ
jgi:uncharacterized protein